MRALTARFILVAKKAGFLLAFSGGAFQNGKLPMEWL